MLGIMHHSLVAALQFVESSVLLAINEVALGRLYTSDPYPIVIKLLLLFIWSMRTLHLLDFDLLQSRMLSPLGLSVHRHRRLHDVAQTFVVSHGIVVLQKLFLAFEVDQGWMGALQELPFGAKITWVGNILLILLLIQFVVDGSGLVHWRVA